MRAIRRARRSRAARRASPSIRSQGIGEGIGASCGAGGFGSGGSRMARVSCTVALLLRRSEGPAVESVEEKTQLKQIAEAAKHARAGAVISAHGSAATLTLGPVGPLGRNERATSVGQAGQHEEHALAPDTANARERTTLKWVTLAGNRYRSGEISVTGSLSPLPSTGSTTTSRWRGSPRGCPTNACSSSSGRF